MNAKKNGSDESRYKEVKFNGIEMDKVKTFNTILVVESMQMEISRNKSTSLLAKQLLHLKS